MRERDLIIAAKTLSKVFNPFYLPIVGLIILFLFTYLNMLPTKYKLMVLAIVYICTILLPSLLIRIYRNYQGWTLFELGRKERRMVPYLISILCYALCYYFMYRLHIPHFMKSIIVAALGIQLLCTIINIYWKISAHSAAIGGMTGALVAFSGIFNFNPVFWLCVMLFIAGLVGTSRIVLRQHSLSQVVCGFLLGVLIGFISIWKL